LDIILFESPFPSEASVTIFTIAKCAGNLKNFQDLENFSEEH